MLRGGSKLLNGFLTALLAVSIAIPATAQVSGPCANCHTMHDSQDGAAVAERYDGYLPNSWPLLSKDCVSCHSADDGSTWQDPVTGAPIVYNRAEPTYGADAGDGQKQGLAAGNFYWVDQDDTFGHNIFAQDPNLERAPGWRQGCALSCHNNLWRPTAYEGTGYARQCTKCHIADMFYEVKKKFHHADDSGPIINSIDQGGYRFLATVHGDLAGFPVVWGIEDPDWEYSVSSTDHNEYMGLVIVKNDKNPLFKQHGKNITAFCMGCHQMMHYQDDTAVGSAPWFQHPADQPLPATGEYAGYTVYDPLTPVARAELTAVSPTVTPGSDMVMCLSCHRAHGSPYPDMLRFPYDQMQAGGGGVTNKGCFKCHTAKDGS